MTSTIWWNFWIPTRQVGGRWEGWVSHDSGNTMKFQSLKKHKKNPYPPHKQKHDSLRLCCDFLKSYHRCEVAKATTWDTSNPYRIQRKKTMLGTLSFLELARGLGERAMEVQVRKLKICNIFSGILWWLTGRLMFSFAFLF